jgi:hypothetical protein
MCSKTLLLCSGVVGALLWILLGMSVVAPLLYVSGRTAPLMFSKTLLLCAGVVGALLWILLGMSVVAPLL